jgi:DNA-binding response OmpR family regulator/DNA-binding CsgD family transcriptional regulator
MIKNPTIMVIDDEPSNIQAVLSILNESDIKPKILSSSNSVIGCQIIENALPDLIILDWEMPQMNGIDVLNFLQKNDKTKNIPVVMATGVRLSSDDLKLALEVGAYDYIRKPIDDTELIARVKSALKICYFFNSKVEHQRQITELKEEHFKKEIEIKKKELVSKSMILINFNNILQNYLEKVKQISKENCKEECIVFNLLKKFASEIVDIDTENIWKEFEYHFEQIHHSFYQNIAIQFPDISQNEMKLCAYIRLNLSTKDIASITRQSIRSIEVARTRLRDKLGLKGSSEDIFGFLMKY